MEACGFEESNTVLGPPPGVSENECQSLQIHRMQLPDGSYVVVSCHKVTKEELNEINRTGRVWLMVWGITMPPVYLMGVSPWSESQASTGSIEDSKSDGRTESSDSDQRGGKSESDSGPLGQ
jgi:hypothetical protein